MAVPLIVLGSANRDYTVVVDRHPHPGETLLGRSLVTGTGGKGSNQAAAAARAGATPVFIAAVGADSSGDDILADLSAAGVDIGHVGRSESEPTGVALITVSADGENTIVVAAGANATLTADGATDAIRPLADATTVLLTQLEVPLGVVRAAADVLESVGGRVALNLSPYQDIPGDLLALADPLIVNESEAAELAGSPIESVADAEDVAELLLGRARSVVITLGGDGVVLGDSRGNVHLPAERVTVVDTTGAGDAFAGALAASLSRGEPLSRAARAGIEAGAAAVQHVGAQPPR